MARKLKRRTVSHLQHKHAKSFNFASGMIYSAAAIVAIAFGGLFYRSFDTARQTLEADRVRSEVSSPDLPPGATVVVRSGGRSVETPRIVEPLRKTGPAPAPSAGKSPTPASDQAAPAPETEPVATPDETPPPASAMPSVAPLLPQPWQIGTVDRSTLQQIRIDAIADTAIVSSSAARKDDNAGAMSTLPIQGNTSIILADYDLGRIRGWTVTKSTWFAKVRQGRATAFGFSTIPTAWKEGSGSLQGGTVEGATWKWADRKKLPWRDDEAPLPYLIRGNAGSLFSVCAPAEPQGGDDEWIRMDIDPVIVQAMVAGLSRGMVITDEKGQLGAPMAIASREATNDAHYLEIEGGIIDMTAPGKISDLQAYAHPDLRRDRSTGAVLTWTAVGDDGDSGQAFSYDIRYAPAPATFDRALVLPQDRAPWPQPAGRPDKAIIEGLEPGTTYTFFVSVRDETGQAGPPAEVSVRTTSRLELPAAAPAPASFDDESIDIVAGAAGLRMVDEFTPLEIVAGSGAEDRGQGGPMKSFFWERSTRTVRLRAARGETTGFLIALERKTAGFPEMEVGATPPENSKNNLGGPGFSFYRSWYSQGGRGQGEWIGDALIPLRGKFSVQSPANRIPDQQTQGIYAELPIPSAATPGTYVAQITFLRGDGVATSLNVLIDVLPLELPVVPRFSVELLAPPTLALLYKKDVANRDDAQPIERSYHRVAYDHRCTLVMLPYLRNGSHTPPFMPPATGTGMDLLITSWTDWDDRFGGYMDGSAFAASPDGPRAVTHMILPVFDNWPTPFQDGFLCIDKKAPAAGESFNVFSGISEEIYSCMSSEYWRGIRAGIRQFRDHFRSRAWMNTAAHFWLMNGPASSYEGDAPVWFLGAPIYRDDFVALENYAQVARADMSTWPPNGLQVRITVTNVAALAQYGIDRFQLLSVDDGNPHAWDALRRRKSVSGETLWFQSPALPAGKRLAAIETTLLSYFLGGADGWSIQETIGRPENWMRASGPSLFYCGAPIGREEAVSSMRLKALRRAAQDAEYLLLLQDAMGWTREQLADFVYQRLPALDRAPDSITPADLHVLRHTVQELLLTMTPDS